MATLMFDEKIRDAVMGGYASLAETDAYCMHIEQQLLVRDRRIVQLERGINRALVNLVEGCELTKTWKADAERALLDALLKTRGHR